ncbi:hypothetical protein I5730_14540 [Acinetobacter nosocomialis]|jgi:hypothetical protein|uniref:hypothetical protein n=1 Tax=Acinetobacter TaxID=469 RepID=UPI0018FF85F7|nr:MULTISPECIES: hypothetical protein [Acinetobacter]MBJ9961758.1 hypothetical protein [Acinetobacter nosocomialis]MCO8114605.1 hypothetical protein [Acinetobacter lwoffii]
MKSLQSLALTRKALKLIAEKATTKTTMAVLRWNKEALALLGQAFPKIKTDESNPDYQYLQSVIKRELPNMNDPDIGNRMTDILNRNSENSAFLSYVQQAVAAYREALLAASTQFLWGNA